MNVWLLFFSMMITHSGPCEMIANDRIFGEDLAKALPAFLDKIPGDAVIGYSPAPGVAAHFQRRSNCGASALPTASRSRRMRRRVSNGSSRR